MRPRSLSKRSLFVLATCRIQLKIAPLPVSEAVAARRLCHPRGHNGPANLCLNDRAFNVVASKLPTAFPNPAARSLACRPLPGVITTGTRRFTLARTTPLKSQGFYTGPAIPATQAAAGSGARPSSPLRAVHGIPYQPVQLLKAVCLRVNKVADGAGPVGAVVGFVHDKGVCIREPAITQPLHMLLQLGH
jgi:hypothetical protein